MVTSPSLAAKKQKLENGLTKLFDFLYVRSIPGKVKALRRKQCIRVLFIVSELSVWKTESLYLMMLAHPRFEPILGLTLSVEVPESKEVLRKYLEEKGYAYVELTPYKGPDSVHPDIIFYQKPYRGAYLQNLLYDRCYDSLFCYVGYAFNSMNTAWAVHPDLYYKCWQIYFENQISVDERQVLMHNKGKNLVNTGLPMMDALTKAKEEYPDPWKQLGSRKRIIYAPHHTIGDMHIDGIAFATFLEHGEFMLQLAERYASLTQWAFKPHPLLYKNLLRVWGEERTQQYYERWAALENAQVETGKYEGLFRHSDAMIHDCSSFTAEYHYTKNPVLYLTNDAPHDLNKFFTQAYELHYKARTHEEIEQFVINVIAGHDPRKEEREAFYQESLLPPNGKSACENIIDAILGQNGYH